MSKTLKGAIFSLTDVFVPDKSWKPIPPQTLKALIQLIKFLKSKGIQPIVFANREKLIGNTNLEKVITDQVGELPWLIVERDESLEWKPRAGALPRVLQRMDWDRTEAIYIGNSRVDMQAAVNAKVLFLNATWYGENTPYGIKFDSPQSIAQFVDIFCLRKSLWHYAIEDDDFAYYSLAPFSTLKPEFAVYSQDAKDSAKFGAGHPDFWTKYLWSTIYFSELYKEIDFIVPYPGHKSTKQHQSTACNIIEEPMLAFAKCFGIEYLRDLIVRHTTAIKSQSARNSGVGYTLGHCNQLNTIHLNLTPLKGSGKQRFPHNPLVGKVVLIVDDICTQGYSLDAARVYIKKAGAARVICLSWLKTINTDYMRIRGLTPSDFDPFDTNRFEKVTKTAVYSYRNHIVDRDAPGEIDDRLAAYDNWAYPDNI